MNIIQELQRQIDLEGLEFMKNNSHKPTTPHDFSCIFSVGTDGRIHILHHSKNIPDNLLEDIPIIESDTCDQTSAPGVYKGTFTWDSMVDYETGYDEGCFIISEDAELLYQLPDEYIEN